MKLKWISLVFALLTWATARAHGPLLLEIQGADGKPALTLERSEVQAVEVRSPGTRGQIMLAFKEPAAQRWREALKSKSALWSAMLGAQVRVRSVGVPIPPGVLLDVHSARLLPEPMWMWDARAATLLLVLRGKAPSAPAADCASYDPDRLIFWFEEREVQPGEVLAQEPLLVRGPHDFQPVAAACISGWRLSPGAPAKLDPLSGLGMVAPDAKDGTAFAVLAQVGTKVVEGRLRVIDPAQHPLLGLWRQVQEADCATGAKREPPKPLNELRFKGSGQFSATWVPFESYIDYSGTYRFDPAKGELQLVVTGGNDLPAAKDIKAKAHLDPEGRLVVTALPGGLRNPTDAKVCEMVFVRQGAQK